jgi:hypothetical protein
LRGSMPGFSLLLAWTLLFQAASTHASPDALRELVASSELIAWVRVEDVRLLDLGDSGLLRHRWPHGAAPYALLSVESIVFGDGDPVSVLAFVGDAAAAQGGPRVGVGERALVFLERDRSLEQIVGRKTKTSPSVRAFVAGRTPWTLEPTGLFLGTPDGERLQRRLPRGRPPGSESADALERATFLEQLERTLDLELPRFEAKLVSNGARPFRVAIPADGQLRGTSEGVVEPSQLQRLWEAVERERFDKLPALVGRSGAPCLSAMELCVITRRSRRSVGIELGGIDGLADGELREATLRALRIWEAVPVPERPVLR